MANVYNVDEKMHKMRAKLYPNYLPKGEGTYIARTNNEGSVSVEQICAAMRNRGGFDGSYEDAVQTTHHFFLEMMYQLADGFSVNLGFGTLHPNIGGTFHSDKDPHDPKKHPISFRFQALKPLRRLQDDIGVIIEGYADTQGYIAEFYDHENDSTNGIYEPGNQFILTGDRLKIAGDDPSVGLFFIPVGYNDPPVKAARIVENTNTKLIGIIPDTSWAYSKLEIRTQFNGSSNTFLKTPKVITSNFQIEHV